MAIQFPADPGAQTPVNEFSPTSTPLANTENDLTFTWNGSVWNSSGSGGGGGGGDQFWERDDETLSPTNSGDSLHEIGNVEATGTITLGPKTVSGRATYTALGVDYNINDEAVYSFATYDSDNKLLAAVKNDGSITAANKIVINPDSVNASDDRTRLQIGEGAGTARELALLYTTDSQYQGPALKVQHRNSTNTDAKFLECVKGTDTVAEIKLDGSASFKEKVEITGDGAALHVAVKKNGTSVPINAYDRSNSQALFRVDADATVTVGGPLVARSLGESAGVTNRLGWTSTNDQIVKETSSARTKTDVETADPAMCLDIVKNSRPVWYRSNQKIDNPEHSFWGFIAEEVEQVAPRLTCYDADGKPNGVAYARYTPVLVSVLQQALTRIEALEAEVAALKS